MFVTGRAYDQIRSSICIPKLEVKICGSSCGLSDYGDGKTHQSIDDIALMRVLPNMTVLAPVDAVETRKMVAAMVDHEGPVYIRMGRNDLPVLTDEQKPYQIGETTVLREGSDIVIFANGVMVAKAMEAAEIASGKGISIRVVNLSTVKPFPVDAVRRLSAGMKGIVTAEEHNVFGGVGSAVAEALSEIPAVISMLGIEDSFGTSAANYDELLEQYGLTVERILEKIERIAKKN